jgi:hypothetical protein
LTSGQIDKWSNWQLVIQASAGTFCKPSLSLTSHFVVVELISSHTNKRLGTRTFLRTWLSLNNGQIDKWLN